MHGLYRSLINNMVVGVSEGYKIELELVGVGFRASNSGQVLEMALEFLSPSCLLDSSRSQSDYGNEERFSSVSDS